MFTLNKEYKRLQKFKQGQFTEILFGELETMHNNDPRKYMQLVNSLKNGSFDKTKPSDTEAISSDEWFTILVVCLGNPVLAMKLICSLKDLSKKMLMSFHLQN